VLADSVQKIKGQRVAVFLRNASQWMLSHVFLDIEGLHFWIRIDLITSDVYSKSSSTCGFGGIRLRSPKTWSASKIQSFTTLFVFLSLIFLSVGYVNSSDGYVLNVFMDRDIWRGIHFDWLQTVTGPESNTGAGAPGGFFYGLLHLSLLVHGDPVSPEVLRTLMVVASIFAIYAYTYRIYGALPAALITTLYASSGLMRTVAIFWNPGFMPLFAVLITVTMDAYLRHKNKRDIFLVFLLSAIASQIHQQVIFLLAAFALALVWFRVWGGWCHVFVAFVGFTFPFAIFLIKEAQAGFPRMSDMFQRLFVSQYVGHGSPFSFDDILKLELFGRVISSSADPYRGLIGGELGRLSEFGLESLDLVIVAITVGFVAVVVQKICRQPFAPNPSDEIKPLGLFVFIFLVCAVVTVKGYVIGRHLVVIVPAAAILSGLGIYHFVTWAAREAIYPYRNLILAICVGVGALRCVYFGLFGFTSVAVEAYRYPGMMELTKFFRDDYGWSYEDVEARVASYVFDGTSLAPARLTVGSFFDILPSTPKQKREAGTCVIILEKRRLNAKIMSAPADLLKRVALLAPLKPKFLRHRESPHFLFLDYEGRDGNCLKGATNPYISGPLELTGPLVARAPAAPLRNEIRAFEAQFNGVNTQGFAFWNNRSRFPLGILFAQEAAAVVPTLVGREIHGSTGLAARKVFAPSVVFENTVSDAAVIATTFMDKLGTGALGGGAIGYMAPWRLTPVNLEPGTYTVGFKAMEDGSQYALPLGTLAVSGNGSGRTYHAMSNSGR
jgi:hypothetical protein